MAYQAPFIDDSGLHIPTYNDVLNFLIEQNKEIYGQDIYLAVDSADYQLLSIFALMLTDSYKLLQIVYNNRSPKTAVGTALDSIVKLNGIKRKNSSYSSCILTLMCDIGTTIDNGLAEDMAGNQWLLPAVVYVKTIEVEVVAQCTAKGAIEALPGTISKIVTPTKGWISVTNKIAAVTGEPVEIDAKLRDRQAVSVAIPSQSMIASVRSGLSSILGVKRNKVYENDTNITDNNGIPGHSISCVVEGGIEADVAAEIYKRKGIGCGTYGATAVPFIDSDGLINTIKFYRPENIPVHIKIAVQPLYGYTTATKDNIKLQLEAYLKSLDIGTDVTTSTALAAALRSIENLSSPNFTVQSFLIGTDPNNLSATNINIAFNQVAAVGSVIVSEVV